MLLGIIGKESFLKMDHLVFGNLKLILMGKDIRMNFYIHHHYLLRHKDNGIAQLVFITDILGRKTKDIKNELLFYIYDDGTVEKRITIE